MNNKLAKYGLLLVALVCLTLTVVKAQGPGFDDDVEDTPIDGGVAFIMVAAAGYGYKKIADRRKKNAE